MYSGAWPEEALQQPEYLSSPRGTETGVRPKRTKDADKPMLTYPTLVANAILAHSEGATLKEIYAWIEDNFPYYSPQKNDPKFRSSWQSSVRHTLTSQAQFVKTERDRDAKTQSKWCMAEGALTGPEIIYNTESNTGMFSCIIDFIFARLDDLLLFFFSGNETYYMHSHIIIHSNSAVYTFTLCIHICACFHYI